MHQSYLALPTLRPGTRRLEGARKPAAPPPVQGRRQGCLIRDVLIRDVLHGVGGACADWIFARVGLIPGDRVNVMSYTDSGAGGFLASMELRQAPVSDLSMPER